MQLRFLTTNDGKFGELQKLLKGSKYSLLKDGTAIHELQTEDMDALARDKTLRAFKIIGRPLIVDHTGLQFDLLNGFPGGLTSVFYDKLGPSGIAEIIGKSKNRGATAVTLIGYCDGRTIRLFRGELRGEISETPRGKHGFQWDKVFIPEGYDKTFAELGNKKKNEISMRRLAFDKFVAHLRAIHAPDEIDPSQTILFVGAGLSVHLGLPSWSSLIKEIGVDLDFDPDIFLGLGDYLALAEYYEITKGHIGALRSVLDAKWHDSRIDVAKSKAHELIVELGFHKIYTTNFDRWIEKSFTNWGRPYHKIINVNDVAGSKPGITDIVKFHGDFDQDDTLVITESNYFDRLEFEAPLDILLRADALSRPILFVGYSLADINMRYLFHKLSKVWRDAKVSKGRKPSHIFMFRPNPIEEKIFEKWGITPIIDDVGGNAGLIAFLESLRRKSGP